MPDEIPTRDPLESSQEAPSERRDTPAVTDGAIDDDLLDAVNGGSQQVWGRFFVGR